MTALETLKCYTHGKKNTDKVEISVWALNRIINALSQECVDPTQKHVGNALDMRCDDVVSRILKRMWNCRGKHTTSIDKVAMEQIIRNELPPVTPKSETVTEFADRCRECGKMRKGHWIYDKTIENWRCSKCNETPKTIGYVGTADFMAEHFKFCNHCGARMDEPQESEEV